MSDAGLRKRIMSAIFDPGATEGFKGERDLTTWQTDAVMRVIDAEVEPMRADAKLLDAIQHESWDLRCFNIPTGGDDCDIGWSVIGHWQAEPHDRVVAEIYHDDPRAAIRAAIGSRETKSSDIDQRALVVADVIVREMMDRGALLAVRNADDELVPMDLDRQFQVKAGWQTAIAAALKSVKQP